jgi:hypothetical protein
MKMNVADLKVGLHQKLGSLFEEKDYKHRKADFEYIKKKNGFVYIFRIYIHSKTDWFLVEPSVFIGVPKINKQFNEILGRNIQVNGSTFGFGIRNKTNNDRGGYHVDSVDDIETVAKSIWSDFIDLALPFFTQKNSYENIDLYLNGKEKSESVSNACLSLVAANLVKNPNISQLADSYFSFWSKAQSPELAKDISFVKSVILGGADAIKA